MTLSPHARLLHRARSAPVAVAGVLMALSGVLQVAGVMLPSGLGLGFVGGLVVGRGVAFAAAVALGLVAVVVGIAGRRSVGDSTGSARGALDGRGAGASTKRAKSRAGGGPAGRSKRVVALAGGVFAVAIVLQPVVVWLPADAPSPTTEMYVASVVALVLGAVAWLAGMIGVVALFRAGVLARSEFVFTVVPLLFAAVTALLLVLVVNAVPDAPQELLIALSGAGALGTPLLLVAAGAVWALTGRAPATATHPA